MANNYRTVMHRAGVEFQKPFDWDYAIQEDTLVSYPPALLTELRLALRYLSLGSQERLLKIGKGVFGQLIETFSNR